MSQSGYQVRRATVDDLEFLVPLWAEMRLPVPELERRVTDFQIVEGADGRLLGALAMEINGRHGRIHSEVFADFGLAECLRELLWERMHKLVTNHGIVRLWTIETAPFWTHSGFQPAGAETLKKLPAAWAALASDWRTVEMRDEEAIQNALENEFARFRAEERRQSEAALRRAKAVKTIATVLAVMLGILVIVICFTMLRSRMRIPGR